MPSSHRLWFLGPRGSYKNRNRGYGYLRKSCLFRDSSRILNFRSCTWYSTRRVKGLFPLPIPQRLSPCISVIWECHGPPRSVGYSSESPTLKSMTLLLTIGVIALCSPYLSRRCSKHSNRRVPLATMRLGAWVCTTLFSSIHEFNISSNSWMDGSPVYPTRNQSSHFRRTGFRILRPNRAPCKIPTQECRMAHPSLRVVPKESQTPATAVRNQGFGLVMMCSTFERCRVRFVFRTFDNFRL